MPGFRLSSLSHLKKDLREMNQTTPKTVAVSGGFDPLHVGHLEMFYRARELGDRLIVLLNSDHFLMNKNSKASLERIS